MAVEIFFDGKKLDSDQREDFMEYVSQLKDGNSLDRVCFVNDPVLEDSHAVIQALNDYVTEGMNFQYLADDEDGRVIGIDLFDEQNDWIVVDELTISACE